MESQVAKMYENAGIEPEIYEEPSREVDNDGKISAWYINEIYPPFTAEKQMLLLDFLSKYEITIINESNTPYYMIYTHDKIGSVKANNIGELMAKYINMFIWQDLTEQEREQIRSILNGN